MAFNVGSFVVEYSVIVAHVRLLTELKDQADRLRENRHGLATPSMNESGSRAVASVSDGPVPLS